jgi:uncharacterized membrane protein YgcG
VSHFDQWSNFETKNLKFDFECANLNSVTGVSMKLVIALLFLSFSVLLSSVVIPSTALAASECQAACTSDAGVGVDLGQKCMCIGKSNCFKISIGKGGPSMTTSGSAKMHEAKGDKYSTKQTTDVMSDKDQDAIATGIPENDATGKWIHKTRSCGKGGQENTLGCIAVPCDHWKEIKDRKDANLTICGGGSGGKSGGGHSGGSSGSDGGSGSSGKKGVK